MVTTRHNWEDEEEIAFKPTRSSRSRDKAKSYGSDEGQQYDLKKRRGVQSKKGNESSTDSTDDTQPDYSRTATRTGTMEPSISRRTRHMRHRRVIEEPDHDVEDDTDEDVDVSPRRTAEKRTRQSQAHSTRSNKQKEIKREMMEDDATEEDTEQEERVSPSHHHLRRRTHPPARMLTSEYEVMDTVGVGGCRRSGRQRKLVYSSFNQNLINKHLAYPDQQYDNRRNEEQPRRKGGRRRGMVVGRMRGGRYGTRRRDGGNNQESHSTEDDDDDDHDEDSEENENNGSDEDHQEEEDETMANMDMYTRVKRVRRQVKRDMYGMPLLLTPTNENHEGESESSSDDSAPRRRSYDLRVNKPRTELYKAPISEPRPRSNNLFGSDIHKPKRSYKFSHHSPARRAPSRYTRRRRTFLGSSSTSSSSSSGDGDDSGDESRFQRRKKKSMAKARNRCLPMNLSSKDVAQGMLKERAKVGSSLADIDPMTVDTSVTFDSVGGLGKHVRSLKEMVVFPLMYPEVFEHFKIAPPRGVLFYGPPGTGKTLVARALANECSTGDHKVAFFMRKGADCLSKWVGESERQLRLLFDQAYQMRPSIIFFDEIDGLAPVRSSRQDQIHSSIVSTLLALMDGLDSRGEVVVIGATNRLDSIDPALRRPGRFDREFAFPLPPVEARAQILSIHTKAWSPRPSNAFLCELAEKTVGYCGADLRALCTEAALHGFRRRYPQVYDSKHKLQLDVENINISAGDFKRAMAVTVPTSQRSVSVPSRRLSVVMQPLLQNLFDHTVTLLNGMFSAAMSKKPSSNKIIGQLSCADNETLELSDDDDEVNIYDNTGRHGRPSRYHSEMTNTVSSVLNTSSNATHEPQSFRPRLLLCGEPGQGQSTHLAPALLHHLEGTHLHLLDLPTLYANSARTPEEACSQVFHEACRNSPSIIFIPHISRWWTVAPCSVQQTFMTLVEDLLPEAPILLLATAETQINQIPCGLDELFSVASGQVVTMQNPVTSQRREFFLDLLLVQTKTPPASKRNAAKRALEILPKASPPPPRTMSESELKRIHKQEEATMRELRLFLRDVVNKLSRDRKFAIFAKPVDPLEVEDYYEVISHPMDLCTMMSKIDLHQYQTVKQMMCDLDLICSNALEYNPDNDAQGRSIRHRACAMRDTASAILEAELNPEFEKACEETLKAIQTRGESPMKHVPDYYYTKPANNYKPMMASLDEPEKLISKPNRPEPNVDNSCPYPGLRRMVKFCRPTSKKSYKQLKNVSPWCRPSKRARKRKVVFYVDDFGNEVDVSQWNQDGGCNKDQENSDLSGQEDNEKMEKESDEDSADSKKQETRSQLSKHTSPRSTPQASPAMPIITRRSSHSPRVRPDSHSPRVKPDSPRVRSEDGDSRVGSRPSRRSSAAQQVSPPVLTPIEPRDESTTVTGASDSTVCGSPEMKRRRTRSGEFTPNTKPESGQKLCTSQNQTAGQHSSQHTSSPHVASRPPIATSRSPIATSRSPVPAYKSSSGVTKSPTKCVEEDSDGCKLNGSKEHTGSPVYESALTKSAHYELSAPIQIVTGLDDERLRCLLDLTVKQTSQWNIEQLQRLHTQISSCIYQHRREHDKSILIEDLERLVKNASI